MPQLGSLPATTQACDQVKAEPQQGYDQFMEELDIVGVNYTDRWRERTETFYDEEKREHPDWLLMGSEDGSVGGLRPVRHHIDRLPHRLGQV